MKKVDFSDADEGFARLSSGKKQLEVVGWDVNFKAFLIDRIAGSERRISN